MRQINLDISGLKHHYELNGVLGRGTKCIVYIAYDLDMFRPCIIKELYPKSLQNEGMLYRNNNIIICDSQKSDLWIYIQNIFMNGFRILSDYSMRNKCYSSESIIYSDVIPAYGSLYVVSYEIALEWNPSLKNISKLLDEFIQVCDCIGHMHRDEKQILAMDIKTSNFVLSDGKVKLTDFDGLIPKECISYTKSLIYSSSTASPEVLEHRYKDISPASDVYSIMLMMAQIMTNDNKIKNNIYSIEKSLTELNIATEPFCKLYDLFNNALRDDIKARPKDCLDLGLKLRQIRQLL